MSDYDATHEGRGTEDYFTVYSKKSKTEHKVSIGFRCTCKHHSLFPNAPACEVVKSAMRKLIGEQK